MQSTGDQPSGPSNNGESYEEGAARPLQEQENFQNPPLGDVQGRPAQESTSEQGRNYQGTSEQVQFPPAPDPYQSVPPISAQPGALYPAYQQPGQPGSAYVPSWTYPPRAELYQHGLPMQPGSSASQPLPVVGSGQLSQPHQSYAQPFYSSMTTPIAPPGGSMGGPPTPTPRRSGLRTGTLVVLIVLLAGVFGTGLFAGWQFGHNGATSPASSSSPFQSGNTPTVTVPQPTNNNADAVREAVVSKVQPAVVQINVASSSQQALGSGVIIDRRGYIVTNNHVVTGASSIQVTLANGQVLPAQLVGNDTVDDISVIKVTPPPGGLTTVTLGDSSQLRVGQDVLAIGSPLGNAETVTSGIISALNRNVSEGQNSPTLPDAIQTDAPINPGNSGGALVDLQGNLIGMPTLDAVDTEFNTPANGLGFAIPVNRIKFIAEQIIDDGSVLHTGRAILGITVTSVTLGLAQQDHLSVTSGVFVVSVTPGGPAATAGLKANDVIVQLNNQTINGASDLSAAMLQEKPGANVSLKVYRGSQQLTINVTLGELAAN